MKLMGEENLGRMHLILAKLTGSEIQWLAENFVDAVCLAVDETGYNVFDVREDEQKRHEFVTEVLSNIEAFSYGDSLKENEPT